jgi:hypothetical protein
MALATVPFYAQLTKFLTVFYPALQNIGGESIMTAEQYGDGTRFGLVGFDCFLDWACLYYEMHGEVFGSGGV